MEERATTAERYFKRLTTLAKTSKSKLPQGNQLLPTIAAFVITISLLFFGMNVVDRFTPYIVPKWIETSAYLIGLFAAYTAWEYSALGGEENHE